MGRMQLKDFISSTIEQVARGVLDAAKALKDTDALVAPHPIDAQAASDNMYGQTNVEHKQLPALLPRIVHKLEFDIAVTVEEESGKSGSAKLSVWSAGIGGDVSTAKKASNASRVRFSIPLVLPTQES